MVYAKGLEDGKRAEYHKSCGDKTEQSITLLKRVLRTLLFTESREEEIDMVIGVMDETHVQPNTFIILQGGHGDKFYVVAEGKLDFIVNNNIVGSVEAGGHFGELALIYDAPRAASVRSKTACTLWTLGRDDFRTIQAQSSSDSLVKRAKWLENVPILERLSARQLSLLAGALESVVFEHGDTIIEQGQAGDSFYIVEEGNVACHVSDPRRNDTIEVARLSAGNYFGEMALLNDQPRNATILAVGSVKCLKLGRREFDSMLGPLSSVLENNGNKRILKMFPRFQDLSEPALDTIVAKFESVEFASGEIICSVEDTANAFYIVRSGQVAITQGDKELKLSLGDFFGEEMFQEGNYACSAVVESGSVQCARLTDEHLEAGEILTPRLNSTMDTEVTQSHAFNNVDFNELVEIGVLGEGSFGKVSMVQAFVEGEEYILALKCMSKSHIVECHQQVHVMREKQIMMQLPPHPFIVRLYATHQNQNNLYMLMDLIQGGELFSLLHNEDEQILEEADVRFYAANVFLALEHLHRLDIAYRDLKPENLLLGEDGYLKLVDMGFCKQIPFTIVNENGQEETHSRSYTLCGTQEYLAPEFVLNTGHDLAVDYWALGILIYEMMLGYTPFEEDDGDIATLFKNIAFVRTGANKVRFPREIELSRPDACDFVRKLLVGDPTKRIGVGINGANEIRTHPWFKDFDWSEMIKCELPAPSVPEIQGKYDTSCFEGDQGVRSADEPFGLDEANLFKGF